MGKTVEIAWDCRKLHEMNHENSAELDDDTDDEEEGLIRIPFGKVKKRNCHREGVELPHWNDIQYSG